MSIIDPIKWLRVANMEAPQTEGLTPWFDGTTKPPRSGYYERHFTDSMFYRYPRIRQYWDGRWWRAQKRSKPHWRQVGDYPCWRGLAQEGPKG